MAPRPNYLLVADPMGGEGGERRASAEARLAGEGVWTRIWGGRRLSVWTAGPGVLRVQALPGGRGVALGDLFANGARESPPLHGRPVSPMEFARSLLRTHWGRYLAIYETPEDAFLLRDPSGEIECLTWTLRDGLRVTASDLAATPGWLRPHRMALNWDRIVAFVASPGGATSSALLDDVLVLPPGAFSQAGGAGSVALLWRVVDFAAVEMTDAAAAADRLLECVDRCVVRSVDTYGRVLVDLSGGLDSSIVAGALGHAGMAGRVAQWVNRVGDRPEGDERRYAQAVTERLGASITPVPKPLLPLQEADYTALATATWPAVNAVDPARDQDMAARLLATGAEAIVSGQGGDAVFYQMPSAWIASDLVRQHGLLALGASTVLHLARRLRKPIWTVYREARAGLARGAVLPSPCSSLLTPAARAFGLGARHPWVAAAADLPLARQLQVAAIANMHLVRGDCRRRRAGDLIFPLAAQPLVELCLSIPVEVLADGVQDRAFARQALAARIPDIIRQRRSKGSLTSYFSRLVAASRDTLLPYLRDGCLAAAGVLDRSAVEDALNPEQLIWSGSPNDVLVAAATEAWVRYWQSRAPDSATAGRRSIVGDGPTSGLSGSLRRVAARKSPSGL